MVLGEGRHALAALLVLEAAAWRDLAAGLGLDPGDPAALRRPEVRALVLERVRDRLRGFPSYAQVRGLYLTLEPWTVENGLLTPTMKLRRPRLEAHFKEAIRRLYGGRGLPGQDGRA